MVGDEKEVGHSDDRVRRDDMMLESRRREGNRQAWKPVENRQKENEELTMVRDA